MIRGRHGWYNQWGPWESCHFSNSIWQYLKKYSIMKTETKPNQTFCLFNMHVMIVLGCQVSYIYIYIYLYCRGICSLWELFTSWRIQWERFVSSFGKNWQSFWCWRFRSATHWTYTVHDLFCFIYGGCIFIFSPINLKKSWLYK